MLAFSASLGASWIPFHLFLIVTQNAGGCCGGHKRFIGDVSP